MSNRRRKLIITAASLLLILLCLAAAAFSVYLAQNVFLPALGDADETENSAESRQPVTTTPGLLVVEVEPESVAARAGIERSDVIISVSNLGVDTPEGFLQILAGYGEGDTVRLTVLKDGIPQIIPVTMDARAPYLGLKVAGQGEPLTNTKEPSVTEITRVFTPSAATPHPPSAGLDLPFNRPVVTGIIDHSPAADADFRPGDIITNVNEQAILTSDELIAAIGGLKPGDKVDLIYRRGQETLTARVTLGTHPRSPEQGFLGVELGGNNSQFQFGDPFLPDE